MEPSGMTIWLLIALQWVLLLVGIVLAELALRRRVRS
jgi:hypothetical protein